MRRFLKTTGLIIVLGLCLAGCKFPGAKENVVSESTDSTESTDTTPVSVEPDEPDVTPAMVDTKFEIDYKDKASVMSFLEGEWSFVGPYSGEEYAKLKISKDGVLSFSRNDDIYEASGTLELTADKPGDTEGRFLEYNMDFTGLASLPFGDYYEIMNEDSDGFHGDFYVGRSAGRDYLYLRLLGNGVPYVTDAMFAEFPDENNYGEVEWYLTRDNSVAKEFEKPEAGKYDVFVWGYKENTLTCENMVAHSYETYEDYTERHIMAKFYDSEPDMGVYELKMDKEKVRIPDLDKRMFDKERPSAMYTVEIDKDGNVKSIESVLTVIYGAYYDADIEPEISINGMEFKYNSLTYNLFDYAEAPINAVMGYTKVGDRIVIDCHVNPNVSDYMIYNTVSAEIEKNLIGSNLIWRGDDITSAVYAYYNDIYDYSGRRLAQLKCDVLTMEFGNQYDEYDTVKITGTTPSGENVEGEVQIQPYIDKNMYAYFDYRRKQDRVTWQRFKDLTPKNALVYVLENVPSKDAYGMWYAPMTIDDSVTATDTLSVVALFDNTDVKVYAIDYELQSDNTYKIVRGDLINEKIIDRGDQVSYLFDLPETFPAKFCIDVSAGGKSATIEAYDIKGMYDNYDTFYPAD